MIVAALAATSCSSGGVLIPVPSGADASGYIDANGKWVIPAKFEATRPFSEGLAPVRIDGKYGYIDRQGTLVIQAKYAGVGDFSEGLAVVVTGSSASGKAAGYGWIDTSGRAIGSADWDEAGDFSGGLAPVQRGKLCGYVNKKDQVVIPLKFDAAGDFSEGLALVQANGKWGYIDKTGAWRIQPQFEAHGKGVFIGDSSIYAGAGRFKNGFAAINSPAPRLAAYFIDKSGKKVFGREFLATGEFSEGLAPVEINGKWGFIDTSGRFAIQPKLDEVGRLGGYGYSYQVDGLHEGLAYVQIGAKFGYMDRTGKVVIQPRFYSAYPYGLMGIPGFNYVLLDFHTLCVINKSGKVIYSTTNPNGWGD